MSIRTETGTHSVISERFEVAVRELRMVLLPVYLFLVLPAMAQATAPEKDVDSRGGSVC